MFWCEFLSTQQHVLTELMCLVDRLYMQTRKNQNIDSHRFPQKPSAAFCFACLTAALLTAAVCLLFEPLPHFLSLFEQGDHLKMVFLAGIAPGSAKSEL